MRCSVRSVAICLFALGFCLYSTSVKAQEIASESAATGALPLWQAVVLGLIEGATEYLPVSSTGHLLIFQHWMGKGAGADETEAANALAICIQVGAILAVVLLYFGRLKQIIRGLLGGDPDGLRLAINLIIAFFPAAVVGLAFHRKIKAHLFNIHSVTIAIFVGALIILAMPRTKTSPEADTGKELREMTWWDAIIVGLFQCFAFWPGFSRSLSTIIGCRLAKLKMSAAVEFSFLLGLITLSAATAKEGLEHGSKIIEYYGVTSPIVALVVAFVAAVVSVRFMVGMLTQFGLAPFGYYRILLAALCLLLW